jgi:hypothetical protein
MQLTGKPYTRTRVSLTFETSATALDVAGAFETGPNSMGRMVELGDPIAATIRETTTIRMRTPRNVAVDHGSHVDVYGRR